MKIFRTRRELRRLPVAETKTEAEARITELAVAVQSALKVGAAVEAREAGRRAFAELMKILTDRSKSGGQLREPPSRPRSRASTRRRAFRVYEPLFDGCEKAKPPQ
jgi:hypothetical protein